MLQHAANLRADLVVVAFDVVSGQMHRPKWLEPPSAPS